MSSYTPKPSQDAEIPSSRLIKAVRRMSCTQGSEQYDEALEATHIACARRLQHLCESNGGVYVKAAQLLSTAQSLPAPYRRHGMVFACWV